MGQYTAESGIKVIDRAVAIVRSALDGPRSLNQLCDSTGLPRATVHRIATALEVHDVLSRDHDGHWQLGTALNRTGSTFLAAARPVMTELVALTGESVQLYQRTGSTRTCIAAVEPESGLRNTVPVGSELPLNSGSAAKIVLAHSPKTLIDDILPAAVFDEEELTDIRGSGVAESVSEREVGLASLSAPIFSHSGDLALVLSISGPAERLRPSPAHLWGTELKEAAGRLTRAL